MKFELQLLGTNGALPAHGRFPTQQVLQVHHKQFLIDCGEGLQMQLDQSQARPGHIQTICISHEHGDHILGLPGLLSSWALNAREKPVDIYGPPAVGNFLKAFQHLFQHFPYAINFNPVESSAPSIIYEDQLLQITAFPLRHRVPTYGYLFREQPQPRRMLKSAIERYCIPFAAIPGIKNGQGYHSTEDGYIPNDELTAPPPRPRSYAFCSDTAYHEPLAEWLAGTDLIYHEATFSERHKEQARKTMHATASQAAQIALLAGARQLVIGHYSPRYRTPDRLLYEACAVFPNTFLGADGMIVPLLYQ